MSDMKHIILKDTPEAHTRLLPLTFTRPAGELTVGLSTICEKWRRYLPGEYSYSTVDYLSELYTQTKTSSDTSTAITIAGNLLPDASLAAAIGALAPGEELHGTDGTVLAQAGNCDGSRIKIHEHDIRMINRPCDIFLLNGEMLKEDFEAITRGLTSEPISPTCTVIGDPGAVFIARGARVDGVILNTTSGPIYIGEDAEVMEGSCLRGPIGIMEHATVNMCTRIYGATTIGTHCKVGGEINNVVMFPYSNKAHDGFLGNAVIGSWCNLGAGCVASNLKNDYTEIKLWDYESRRFLRTGLQFCGLIMGDHSKAGINTMFNTATVCGVGVNIHGTGFPRNFVASFSEGSAGSGFSDVPMSKFFAIAERVMARRDVALTDADRRMYEAIHAMTQCFR